MPTTKMPKFVKTRVKECRITTVLRAVIMVQRSVQAPGSDGWHQIRRYREKLYDMVADQWYRLTGATPGSIIFPFSEDYVIHRLYTAYRKTSVEIDHSITDFLEEPRNVKKGTGRREKNGE